jgi:putative peptidoglycan lipid II flippase
VVSVYVLIPELARRSEEEQHRYLDAIIAAFFLLAAVLSVVAAFVAPAILSWLFPNIVAAGQLPQLVFLARIMLLQPILLGLSNIFAAVTQARHRYALYAMSPLLYNLGIILGIAGFYPLMGLPGLALGVVLGAILHMAVQVPSVMADGFLKRLPHTLDWAALSATAYISVPRAMALSMTQLAYLGLLSIAGMVASGSIAIFVFAYNLQSVILSVIGASYSVAAFPSLAAALSRGDREGFVTNVANAARQIFFWSLPATALAIVLRAHIVRTILGSGAFDWTATRLTAATLAILVLAVAAQGLMLLLVRGYYAAQRTFVPFVVSAAVAAATLACSWAVLPAFGYPGILVFIQSLMRLSDVPGTGVLAPAVGFAFASIVGVIILAIHFDRTFGGFLRQVHLSFSQSAAASLCAAAVAYIVLALSAPITFASTVLSVFSHGLIAGLAGIAAAALMYRLMGNEEYAETATAIQARLWRMRIPFIPVTISAEDQEITA